MYKWTRPINYWLLLCHLNWNVHQPNNLHSLQIVFYDHCLWIPNYMSITNGPSNTKCPLCRMIISHCSLNKDLQMAINRMYSEQSKVRVKDVQIEILKVASCQMLLPPKVPGNLLHSPIFKGASKLMDGFGNTYSKLKFLLCVHFCLYTVFLLWAFSVCST